MLNAIKNKSSYLSRYLFPWILIWAVYLCTYLTIKPDVTLSGIVEITWINGLNLILIFLFFKHWEKAKSSNIVRKIFLFFSLAYCLVFIDSTIYHTIFNVLHLPINKVPQIWISLDGITYTGYLFFEILAWISILLAIKSTIKKSFQTYLPIFLMFIAIFIVAWCGMHWDFSTFSLTVVHNFTDKILETACIVVVAFCLAATKNKGLFYLACGFFIETISSTIMDFNLFSQAYTFSNIVESGWILGKLLMIYGLLAFAKNDQDVINNIHCWVTPTDSIRAQSSYWCFTVSMLSLAVFFIVTKIISPTMFSSNDQWLPILPAILVIYIVFAVFISSLVARKFTFPFQKMQDTIELFQRTEQIPAVEYKNLYLFEFQQLQDFLIQAFSALQQKRSTEKACFDLASKVAHDIRSPLASLLMVVSDCSNIPETTRLTLRKISTRISDIANNLLTTYKKEEKSHHIGKTQSIIVSLALLNLLTDKKYEYSDLPIKFTHSFNKISNFAFINADHSEFTRMVSNLINNAVDALDGKNGEIITELEANNEYVTLIIKDNGKGMSQKTVYNIMNNIAVASDKKCGYGIGLTQVRETVQNCNGKLAVNSEIGKGTTITLTFPRTAPAEWFADEINLNKGDIVVILDDDHSIHDAWDTRFRAHSNDISLKHFHLGVDAINFIATTPDKRKIFLLADFELLKQNLTGLQVIEKTNIQHSILVTSHYTDQKIRDLATTTKTKILPKQLASEITIHINDKSTPSSNEVIDAVIIDDEKMFVDALASQLSLKGKKIDVYYNPTLFLKNLLKYPKNTKIFMDNSMQHETTGLELAKLLNENNYTQLYMISCRDFSPHEIPSYLKLMAKIESDKIIQEILDEN